MSQYRAIVVDDDQQVRDLLVECLDSSDIEAQGYAEAERVLDEIMIAQTPQTIPDLFVIDLQLESGKMQGVDLINELTDRNVPSAIIAISGDVPSKYIVEAIKIGAPAAFAKPFENIFQLMEKMEYFASIGMKRRLYNQSESLTHGMDPARHHRPVFLSYCNEDKKLATGLRLNIEARDIGVWYAPDALQPGDSWRKFIKTGIDQSQVFIALITDHYLNSPFCIGELARFRRRLTREPDGPLLLLPVLYNSTEDLTKHQLIRPILDIYQYIDLSDRFIDRLTALLGRIQRTVAQYRHNSSLTSASSGGREASLA